MDTEDGPKYHDAKMDGKYYLGLQSPEVCQPLEPHKAGEPYSMCKFSKVLAYQPFSCTGLQ